MFFNFAMPSLIMAVLTYGMHSPLPDGWNRVDVSTISFRGGILIQVHLNPLPNWLTIELIP